MKKLFSALFASIILIFSACADMTNGVFYINNPIECQLIVSSGVTSTNRLSSGTTYVVGEALVEFEVTNQTGFYFSDGTTIVAESASEFSINSFDQEVLNLESTPTRAEFGTHTLNIMLSKGEFSVICSNTDTNSSTMISTPYSAYQLNAGKYYFRVNDKSAVAYVLDGNMQVHDDRDVITPADKGKISVAIQFINPLSGKGDKILSITKTATADEVAHLSPPILLADTKADNVQFFIVGHRVIGIKVK
jgi:hypothetical protein